MGMMNEMNVAAQTIANEGCLHCGNDSYQYLVQQDEKQDVYAVNLWCDGCNTKCTQRITGADAETLYYADLLERQLYRRFQKQYELFEEV